jgi:FtsP/CotA-like multicopper oxidase with cupredoxin domain
MHLHHLPQLVVAKDGFALEQPYWADTVNVAPGERYTVLILTSRNDTRLDVDGNVVGEGLDGAGIWAFHCHILTHAESDQGLFGMVTAFVVLPTEADIAANPDGPPAPAADATDGSADATDGGDGT